MQRLVDEREWMRGLLRWRPTYWLILGTVLVPAVLSVSVGILIIVFYRESWDVAFGVLVLCFAMFAVIGSSIAVFMMRRTGHLARLQAEFISNITHDFRTPLTSIRLFVDTLLQDRVTDPEERRTCLETLARETKRLERMVQRVLTFRHVERRGGLDLSSHDPEELVRDVLALLQVDPQFAERMDLVVEPHLPMIVIDYDSVVEAVRNLVTNALTYSEESVVVTLRSDGEGIAISVRDHGPAIPKSERNRIFNRFYRLPGTKQTGSGLGLAIAKHTALAHEGSLDLKSSSGVGNVFTLRLPLLSSSFDLDDQDDQDKQDSQNKQPVEA